MSNEVSKSGRYRIRVVSEMTGIPSATLRAWERRYGIPSPQRTASSYRLYSDFDVETVRQMRDLCDQGVSPSEAARMLKQRGATISQRARHAMTPPVADAHMRTPWSIAE